MEVHNIIQEAVVKKKKGKMFAEEALQIAEKRREVKGKGEKERHSHLNAEFQRIARRDKKAFLSDQCKKVEEKQKNEKDSTVYLWESKSEQGT